MKHLILSLVGLFSMCMVAYAGHPLMTDDTGTQGKGHVQAEAGLSFFYDKDKVDEVTKVETKGGEAAVSLAVGLFEPLDVVLGAPYVWYSIKENGTRVGREDGIADIALDVKWRFFEKNGWSLAIKPGISVPSGDEDKGLGTGRVGYSLFFIGTKEIESIAIHTNLGYILNENKFDERKDLWHASVAAEVEIIKNLKLMANVGIERNPDPESDNHPAFVLGGVSYDVSDKIILDAGVKYGLTSTEDDWNVLAGLTTRF
ncbi:MAG: transporter [Syntrophaceae bacterium]|nr:transporter [Syntrophaceae bacterium]